MTYMMGAESAKLVADVHEEGMAQMHKEDTEMDLHNNQVGRELGDITGHHISKYDIIYLMSKYPEYKTDNWVEYILIDRVFEALEKGYLEVLR